MDISGASERNLAVVRRDLGCRGGILGGTFGLPPLTGVSERSERDSWDIRDTFGISRMFLGYLHRGF